MSDAVVLTGLGVVSPLGCDVGRFRTALLAATDGTAIVEDLAGPGRGPRRAARVGEIPAREHLPGALLRRMDRLAKMIGVAAASAAEDAGLVVRSGDAASPLRAASAVADPEEVAVVAGSALGNVAESVQFLERAFHKGPSLANPMLFPNLVMNAAASSLAIAFGWRGPNLTVCEGGISGEVALETALSLLETGRAPAVVVAAGDELPPALVHVLDALGLLSPRRGSREWSSPFDRGATGPIGGEGAAALVLEPASRAAARGRRAYAEISGVRRLRAGAAPVWRFPASAAPIRFESVPDLVVASADSSPERDALELALLGPALDAGAAVTSIKGTVGEYGSSGLANVLVAALALADGRAAGLANLERPRADVPSLRREAWSRPFRTAAALGTARGGAAALVELRRVG